MLPRDFFSGFWRKLGYMAAAALVALLLSMAPTSKAQAQTSQVGQCVDATAGCTKQQAYQACITHAQYTVNQAAGRHSPQCGDGETDPNVGQKVWKCRYGDTTVAAPGYNSQCSSQFNFVHVGCPPNAPWNASLKQCFDPAQCLDRNAQLGANRMFPRSSASTTKCVAGCEFKMANVLDTNIVNTQGGAYTVYRGVMEYSGNTCNVTPTVPEISEDKAKDPDPQECAPEDGSLTKVCIKNNGDHCMTAPRTGLQICWSPGETGEKTQGDVKQKRVPGPTEQPPPVTLPNGDTLSKHGESKTTTTTTPNKTTTTTTTNYITTNGTDAGPKGTDAGEPSSGVGVQTPGTGTPNSTKSASGGQDCSEAGKPVVVGDPHLAMVALQAWATRCAVESKDAITSTGDVSDCSQPFTIDGPPKSAALIKIKGLREQICGPDKNLKDSDPNGAGSVDGVGLEGDSDSTFAVEGEAHGADGLDDEGLGFSRTCPTMPTINVMGQSIQFDNGIVCDWLALGGQLLLVLAALVSLRILAAGG